MEGSTYAFASAAVAQEVAVVLLSNANLSASDNGTSEGSAEEVSVLIDGIALNGSEDDLLNELFLKVLNDHTLSTESESLLLNSIKVLDLANIGEEALKMSGTDDEK